MNSPIPAYDPDRGRCMKHRKDGEPCGARAVSGTDSCRKHAGVPAAQHRTKGAIVVELRRWGLTTQVDLVDPGETLLRLVTQSAARVEMYSRLLAEAYEAAERLRQLEAAPQSDLLASETARMDFERVMNQGGVSVLVGYKYAGTQTSGVIATGEALRGLVELEKDERDRCAKFATQAVGAGLAERIVRQQEQLAAHLATAVERVLVRRGLPADSAEVRAEVAAELLALSGGPKTIEGRVAA